MRRRLLILALQLGLIFFIFREARSLILVYYLLAPLLVLPVFFFYKEAANVFLILSIGATVALHGWYGVIDFHPRLVFFWLFQPLLFALLILYLKDLRGILLKNTEEKDAVHVELKNLQAKYQTRLSSLKHLEQQVGSLMNLFEIARDFSECMDFATLTDYLLKKLRTELEFERMCIFLAPKTEVGKLSGLFKVYEMVSEGVREDERELAAEEKTDFDVMRNSKVMVKREKTWSFPIFENEELGAVFSIEGLPEEDLARVEVLSAYLVLLIKKIKLYETVRELAIIDELTQVFVRQHFVERLEEEVKRSVRFKLPLAVLMLDIDHFKRYNDDFGHLVGDATLKEVADLLKKNLRRVDLLGRYGGEEFVIAMPETKIDHAAEVAERIRSNIARHDFQVYNDKTKVTVSQGVEVFDVSKITGPEQPVPSAIVDALIRHADKAMYKAKEEGRNRVCLFKDIKKQS